MKTFLQRINLLKPLLGVIAFTVCINSAAGDSIETQYGDTITGKILSFIEGIITIQPDLSEQAIFVKSPSLKHITSSLPNQPQANHSEILTLTNGDQLPCDILSSKEGIINISTWYAGSMSIDRSKVAAIRFGITTENVIFSGYEPPAKWSLMRGTWTMTDDFHFQGTGHLAQLVDIPDRARFRYTIQWKKSPNFAFRFFAENGSASSKQNTYELIFNAEGLEIRRYLNDQDRAIRIASLDSPEIKQLQKENNSLNLDLRIDKQEGLISLYLDSQFTGTWQDTHESVEGNYVIFDNRSKDATNCVISNLSITAIKGDTKPRFYDPDARSSDTDMLTDNEGEYIRGEIISIETNNGSGAVDRMILIEREGSKDVERIPEHRVSQLLFKQRAIQNPPTKSGYSLTLKNDSTLSISQLKISGEKMTVLHPLLGSIQLSHDAFKSLSNNRDANKSHEPHQLAEITLRNGDKLSGTVVSIKDEHLTINATCLSEAAVFHTSQILSIKMQKAGHTLSADTYSRIEVHHRNQETSGDTISGRLEELTADSIVINTPYSERLTLKRSMIKSLNIISKQQGQYHGPNNIEEWVNSDQQIPAKSHTWQFKEGNLISNSQNAECIGKEMGLRDKAHVRFDVSWEDQLGFSLQLYSSDPQSRQPAACYNFKFDKYAVVMITRTEGREQGHRRLRFATEVKPKPTKSRFDIYVNRETGTANIHIDGQEAGIIQSPIPGTQDLGTALAFVSHPARSVAISNISISPWHGLATSHLQMEGRNVGNEDKPSHNILLINGDNIPCDVGTIKDERMLVRTQHTPINIPIGKIKSVHWHDKREEPKKYRADVRAWFHSGGFITLRLSSIEDGKLSGYSQATGDATFDIKAFSRVDFNIYNAEANEMRTKHLFK